MNAKKLKERFKAETGISEMGQNITQYSEWLEETLLDVIKTNSLKQKIKDSEEDFLAGWNQCEKSKAENLPSVFEYKKQ